MIGAGPSIEMVVVDTKALGETFVRDHGPDKPVLCLCVDGHGTTVALRRTVATQLPVGSTVRVHIDEIAPPHDPAAAALLHSVAG